MNFDPEVKKQIKEITIGSAVCAVMVFLAFTIFDGFSVALLIGCVLGFLIAAGNFILTAVGISIALDTGEETAAKKKLRLSYVLRTIVILGILAGAIILDQKTGLIKWIPVAAGVFYARIVIAARSVLNFLFVKKNGTAEDTEDGDAAASVTPDDEEDEDEEDEFEKFVGHFAKGPVPGKENDNKDKN